MADSSSTGTSALSFEFSPSFSVRVIVRDGEPWFVAADVCEALDVQNVTQAVARLDDDERSMFNIGRQGETTIINESGLYSLILTSRKPEAKKFKKWVTSEVLPAIRKTGRYVAPNAPATPPSANERLTGADLQNIKRMVYCASHGFQFESVWIQAIWFDLRKVLGLPTPQQFGVDHLPRLATELQRINTITAQFHELIRDIEKEAAKRIFRKAEDANMVIADMRRIADLRIAEIKDDLSKLPRYMTDDVQAITDRSTKGYPGNYLNGEQPGYFDNKA